MKIAFLTAGGIAPCLSSSIGALIEKYNEVALDAELIGYLNGYRGLLLGNSIEFPDSAKTNFSTPATIHFSAKSDVISRFTRSYSLHGLGEISVKICTRAAR